MRPHRRGGNGWLILSAVGFVSVILLGVLLASVLPPIIDPLLRDAPADETIVLIAYLYDREGVLNNARDRLAVLGDKGSDQTVADLAANYPRQYPDRAREAQSVSRLSKDLNVSRPAGARPAGQSGKDDLSWLGWVLLGLFLLVMLGSFVASVSRGRLNTALAGLGGGTGKETRASSRATFNGPMSGPASRPMETAESDEPELDGAAHESGIGRWLEMPGQWWAKLTSAGRPAGGQRREQRAAQRRPVFYDDAEQDLARPWDAPPQPEAAAPEPGKLLLSFQSSYRMGQDAYHEVYPILESDTAVLIGACGLSPGLGLDPERPEKYHAMTVWLHDYRNPHVLRNTVLVSRGLYYERPQVLEDWLNTQPIQMVLPAEPGRSMTLEGAALRARVSVQEVETEPISNPNGSIAWLVLRFDITLKRASPSRPAEL